MIFHEIILKKASTVRIMIGDTSTAIVVDNGAGNIKGGLAGDFAPRCLFPNVVGKPKNQAIIVGGDNKDNYVGDEAVQKAGVLKMSYPISHGQIVAWHDMVKVWHHCFYTELLAEIAEQPLLITETANAPASMKLQMANLLFETFNCPAVYFMPTTILALYSTGKTSGIVLDSGHDVTNVMPVYEGYSIREAIKTDNYGGNAIVEQLMKLYEAKIPSLKGNRMMGFDIKEKECSVRDSSGKTLVQSSTMFELPDGQIIPFGSELQEIPEQIFNPVPGGFTTKSVQQLIQESINDCDEILRQEMADNLLVVGGTTMMNGYVERLSEEVRKLVPPVKVEVLKDRIFPAWVGGSLFASLNTFHQTCITREEYMKSGDSVVTRKCLL
jgi:actin